MDGTMKAPDINHYIDVLGRIDYREVHCDFSYDDKTYALLDELFSLIKRIAPSSENGSRELWISAERGSPEDFGNYEEMLGEELVSNYNDFLAWWQSECPRETEWYNLTVIEDEAIQYRAVFLNHRFVIEQDSRKERSYPHDISDFTEWLVSSVKKVISQLEYGTYNSRVQQELPDTQKIGTLERKHLWDIWPDTKTEFFANITQQEIDDFIRLGSDEVSESTPRLQAITANDFYRWCALGYQANQYPGQEMPLRQQYVRHADGRDDGLGKIDPDSPEAFSDWYHNRITIGHPWEVCRGGNSTHISLYIQEDERGYSLRLAGSSWSRTVETIKFFLALHHAGLPVSVFEASKLKARMLGNEKIGIVPVGVFPRYCHSWFPNEGIIDFMNLPTEDQEDFSRVIEWKATPLVTLQKQSAE